MKQEYNLLVESWIPVAGHQGRENISLKNLLCNPAPRELSLDRDDMEMACLQMIVCITQVIFMPKDRKQLLESYKKPMKEADYDKGTDRFKSWFDLLHKEYPFMQTKDVLENKKYEASLQKLFIGLPEKSSDSSSSNAHFNKIDEVKEIDLGLVAIALFQQATNGFGLGSNFYRVGIKGSMPVTTLVYDESKNLRKTIWLNALDKEFLAKQEGLPYSTDRKDINNKPTWVKPVSFDKNNPEYTHQIGLMRGLFFQPAKVKLKVRDRKAIGFFKETGPSHIDEGFWPHPHTPTSFNKNKKSGKSKQFHVSIKKEKPLWSQMLGFLYSSQPEEEGHSRALVVDHYTDVWRGQSLNLSVGGYIKGNSLENLDSRKHETYSLKSGWQKRKTEIENLIDCALQKTQKSMNDAIFIMGKNIKWEASQKKGQEKSNLIKKSLKPKAIKMYFNNSESLAHEIFRDLDFEKIQQYKQKFCNLAKKTYNELMAPYEHDPKMLKAIEAGRAVLAKKLSEMQGKRGLQ